MLHQCPWWNLSSRQGIEKFANPWADTLVMNPRATNSRTTAVFLWKVLEYLIMVCKFSNSTSEPFPFTTFTDCSNKVTRCNVGVALQL